MNSRISQYLILILFLALNFKPLALASVTIDLDTIEKHYFGRSFAQKDINNRLNRIDQLLFGQVQTGSIDEREANILKVYQENIINSKTPKVSNSVEDFKPNKKNRPDTSISKPSSTKKPITNNKSDLSQVTPKNTAIKKYPKITYLESKILKKTYTYQTPELRLDRLESQVLGKPNANLSIDKRISILEKIVNPQIVDNLPYSTNQPNPYTMRQNQFMDLNNQFNRLFDQLDRQFNDFGSEPFNSVPNFNQFSHPNTRPFLPAPNNNQPEIIPPYNSPNCI